MNTNWVELIGKLSADSEYRAAFDKAYGGPIHAEQVLGILLAVSLVLVRFMGPDRAMHERILEAIRTLTVDAAALQRDALEARGRNAAELRSACARCRWFA